MVSPAKAARSGPLRVWKVNAVAPSTMPVWRSTCAEANVAWPHRSISTAGENQRRPKVVGSSEGERNAVSEMPSSKAMDCMRSSSSCSRGRQTAAGLPPKARSLKASTQMIGIVMMPTMLSG
jgi:hypothetical protein